jgi:hypothetical protein
MRRPKKPGQPDKAGRADETPPGGRARKRLEQFNRQRGLSTPLPPGNARDDDGVKRSPGKKHPSRSDKPE